MPARNSISPFFSVLLVLGCMLALAPTQSAHAVGRRYARPVASGSGDCLSWADACSLQIALTGAVAGDEIWVAAGTHTPTADPADRAATFQLKSGVALYGGFAGTETGLAQRNPSLHVTVLSGDIDHNDSQAPVITDLNTVTGNDANSFHVVTGAAGAILNGFTITAGSANIYDSFPGTDCGAGMFNTSGSSPSLYDLSFRGNLSIFAGGGMCNHFSSPTMTDVTFQGNSANYAGGGLFDWGSSPILTNVTFTGNAAGTDGGGIYDDYGSDPTLTNVTFNRNTAGSRGGGIANYDSNPTLTNVTFSANSAGFGGGLSNDYGSVPQIRNTIFWGNTASTEGQIYNGLYQGSAIVSDSVVQDGCPAGSTCTNILSVDPNLGALGDYGGSTPTIPLQPGSSAIDTGNDSVCPLTDQRGVARPQGAHCDIGAFEFIPPVFLPLILR